MKCRENLRLLLKAAWITTVVTTLAVLGPALRAQTRRAGPSQPYQWESVAPASGRIVIFPPAESWRTDQQFDLAPSIKAASTSWWKPPLRPTRIAVVDYQPPLTPGELAAPVDLVPSDLTPPPGWDLNGDAGLSPAIPELCPEALPQQEIAEDALFHELLADECRERGGRQWWNWLSPLATHSRKGNLGVGAERVMYTQSEIDTTQPWNHLRLRVDAVYHFQRPDRAEYFWARPKNQDGGKGPDGPESSVNYQDFRVLLAMGGKKTSVATEIPVRVIDPVVNPNTAGMGDMNVATKLVWLDGSCWQITQILRTYMNTGPIQRGLGNGHVSLEPGLLARYRWSDVTYLHGELKLWIPLGGHPAHSGRIVRYGLGWSHVWYDSDRFALVPSFELVGQSVLDGQQSIWPVANAVDVDGDLLLHAYPGLRIVWDTGGELGLLEMGISGGVDLGSQGWYDGLARFEIYRSF